MKQISIRELVRQGSVAKLREWMPFELISDNEPIAIFVSPERNNTCKHDSNGRFTWEYHGYVPSELRAKVIKLLGEKCVRCGYSDERALQIDHIYGGGRIDRKRLSSVSRYYEHILINEGRGYQLLCANCNVIKAREQGEYGNLVYDVNKLEDKPQLTHDVRQAGELRFSKSAQARGHMR